MVFKQLVQQLILPKCKCETMSNVVQKPKMPEFLWVTRSGFNKCLLGMNLSVIHIVGVVKKNLNFKIVCMRTVLRGLQKFFHKFDSKYVKT